MKDEISKKIDKYKAGRKLPPINDYNKQYEPKKHKIHTDRVNFPDRWVEMDVWDEEKQDYIPRKKLVPLIRVSLPYQKKITSMAVTFLFGVPVKYSNDSGSNENFVDSFGKVLDKNKVEFLDRDIAKSVSRWTECAEYWYTIKDDVKTNKDYGFDTNFSIKSKILNPEDNNLYPIFDENDVLIRFSFSYSKKNEDGDKVDVFKSFTSKRIEHYEKTKGADWVVVKDVENPFDKIPIVYYQQEAVEWEDVQTAIERLEEIYSNTGESNNRFAFPILKIKGEVTGSLTQDKSGKVLELGGEGADADFVEHPNANESLSNEKETLEQDIHDFTSTPNISFDNMKGLGNILSGASAEFLFLSAHLKVKEKLSIYIPALQRRTSIVGAILQTLKQEYMKEDLVLTPVVTPYVINNDAEFFKMLMEINDNQPIISQEESMRRAGIKDPEAMIKAIEGERSKRQELENAGEPNPSAEEE